MSQSWLPVCTMLSQAAQMVTLLTEAYGACNRVSRHALMCALLAPVVVISSQYWSAYILRLLLDCRHLAARTALMLMISKAYVVRV
jgi:hypothetical protein